MNIDQDTLIAYVLGSLTAAEELEVVRYLQANPAEAAWVRDLFETMAEVALTEEPVYLPTLAEDELIARIRGGSAAPEAPAPGPTPDKVMPLPAQPRRRPWVGIALAAALALVVWFGLRPSFITYQVTQQLNRACNRPGALCETLVTDANEPLGTLAKSPENQLLVVLDHNPPAGQVYQAWEIAGGTPQSLGVWDGRVLNIATALAPDSLFGITVEPPGGSPQPTTTPIVVVPLS